MDGLDRLVQAIAPTGSVELQCRFAGEWQLDHPPLPPHHLPYHVILGGTAELDIDGTRSRLQKGDVLLFPYGDAHILRSAPSAGRAPSRPETRRSHGVVTLVEREGEGEPLDMLCGEFLLAGATDALWTGLPKVLHLRTGRGEALLGLIQLLRDEAAQPQPGGGAVIRMVTGAMFALILRSVTNQGQWQQGISACSPTLGWPAWWTPCSQTRHTPGRCRDWPTWSTPRAQASPAISAKPRA